MTYFTGLLDGSVGTLILHQAVMGLWYHDSGRILTIMLIFLCYMFISVMGGRID